MSRALRKTSFGTAAAYSLPFKNHYRGIWLRHGGFWPDRHVRLFRRDAARYDPARSVHEKLVVNASYVATTFRFLPEQQPAAGAPK